MSPPSPSESVETSSSSRAKADVIKPGDEIGESETHHKITESKTVEETYVGVKIDNKSHLPDEVDDESVKKAVLMGGINGDSKFPQSTVEGSIRDADVKARVGEDSEAGRKEVKKGTDAENSSPDEVSEYSDEYSSGEEEITSEESKSPPGPPPDSPPRTLQETYESPVIQGKVTGDRLPTQNPFPDYAEIDFTASGRPISGSTPRSEERPQTSNFFHSDDEDERKGLCFAL